MEKEEIKKVVSSLSETLGNELEVDIERFMLNVFGSQELSIGIRDGYKLTKRKVLFTSIMMFNDAESVVNEKYKPENLLPDFDNYYFASEEIARFNLKETFFGIIGNKWFMNELGDEFAEAIVFGSHNVGSIDCMLCSVLVNNPLNASNYLIPGTLVSLRNVELKNTKYLEVATFLTKIFVSDNSEILWNFGDIQDTFYWDGEYYISEPIYSGGMDKYYDDSECCDEYNEYDYEEEELNNNEEDIDYYDWLNSEFGDDAETAYWNTD